MPEGRDSGVIASARVLAKILVKEIRGFAPDDINYVELILGMSLSDALERDPVAVFLLLLEVYVGYVQHVLMLKEVYDVFNELWVEPSLSPVLDFGYGKRILLSEFMREHEEEIKEVVKLYRKIFIEHRSLLNELVYKVKDEWLRRRLEAFYSETAWLGG